MRSRLAVRTTLDWGPDSNWSLTGPWHAKGRRGLLAADPPFAALGFTKGGFSSADIDPDSNRTLLAWVETFASRAETPVTFEGAPHDGRDRSSEAQIPAHLIFHFEVPQLHC